MKHELKFTLLQRIHKKWKTYMYRLNLNHDTMTLNISGLSLKEPQHDTALQLGQWYEVAKRFQK